MFQKSHPLILIFALLANFHFVYSQTSDCILDIQLSSMSNDSNCLAGDWGGFLSNNCCVLPYNRYLYGLGKRANQTGLIYLNSTQQMGCLAPLKSIEENILSCGIEKLTSGAGGCSDYSVTDVSNNLGNRLRSLDEDCRLLGTDKQSNNSCSACLRRWDEMGILTNSRKETMQIEADICRFAVLVTLMSNRIGDEIWVDATFQCLGEQSLPIDDQGGKKGKKIHTGLWILLGGLAAVTTIVIVASWVFFRKSFVAKSPKGKAASKDLVSEESSSQKIHIKEIYSATNNLSALNFIGQGIAGKVYRGILSNGQHVAVKHILNDGHMETFIREVTSLSHVKHPNLVALLGHCEGEDECFLIYELCHQGNLSEWLFGKDKVLSWIQRIEIAIDCGRGLWFLHTYREGYIVHRDIKPTNILICANFQGKLSDFGLSKVLDMDQSYVSSEVRGTFGYVDPEYQKNHRVNSSGDVYSFGIVLLQLLSGQRVINLDLKKPMPLDRMAKMLTRGGNITEFADQKLNGEYSVEAFEVVIKLALSCTGLKQQRPNMEQVVSRLELALDISTRVNSLSPHFTRNVF